MLGQESVYTDQYAPSLLEPIPRSLARESLFANGTDISSVFTGIDLWTAYELSWLDENGKPCVAIAEFEFPCSSTAIVESKSFKYYLNSFNQTRVASVSALKSMLVTDLTKVCGAPVAVRLYSLDSYTSSFQLEGVCIDDLSIEVDSYSTEKTVLNVVGKTVESFSIYSHLLKSNCPVTGQPDWATIWIEYQGKEICQESFLRYVISFRQHQDFHENCVEKMFTDILSQCQPQALTVYARYTRRGGLDINPFRTNCARALPFKRLVRQ